MSTSMPLRLWVLAPRIVIWSFIGSRYSGGGLGVRWLRAEDFDEEEACADDDAAVGDVEVGPVVVADVDFEEIDDVAVADAVVEVADGSAEDEREGYGAESDGAAYSPEHAYEDYGCDYGEGDEDVANCCGRGGF